MQVNLGEARDKLSQLVNAVLAGEQVTICKDGEPVVDLIRTQRKKRDVRRFGTMRGKVVVHDPNWHKGPETEDELIAWLEGRFE